MAQRLIDERIDDKWTPAGATAIAGREHTQTVQIPARPPWLPEPRGQLRRLRSLPCPGQPITHVVSAGQHSTSRGRPCRGSLTVTVTGEPQHAGWLFFGWASC